MRSPEGPKSSTLLAEKRQSRADQQRLRETRGRASAEVARLRGYLAPVGILGDSDVAKVSRLISVDHNA